MSEPMHESGWTVAQIEAWRKGTWTREKVDALEKAWDEHWEDCEECQAASEKDSKHWDNCKACQQYNNVPTEEVCEEPNASGCSIGDSLLETLTQADTEFSWQPDYDGECDTDLCGCEVATAARVEKYGSPEPRI